MRKYMVEISGINTSDLIILTAEEMKKLFQKYREGDLFAREELIKGNLKLVLSILKRFYCKNENLDDLFQIGCIGLIKAIDHFDLDYDVRFSTYAVPMILGEIKRFIRDNNSLRVSRSLKDIAYKASKLKEEYYIIHGCEADDDYLAQQLGVSTFDIGNAFQALKEPVSMYEPIYNDGGDTIYLYDQIEDASVSNDFSDQFAIENAIQNLQEREKYILDERFVVGKSQMEVAEELFISQAQVSRLEKKAIHQLKKVLK